MLWLDIVPSWAIAAGLAALLMASFGVGRWLRARARRDRDEGGRSTDLAGLATGSVALVSLLLGFTLALSLDRYESRRRLVADEASSISSTWERDLLLDAPYRERLEGLLRAYVKERAAVASAGVNAAALDAADQRAAALQARIWQETVAALKQPDAAPFTTTVIQATTGMFDETVERRAALDAEVPAPVLWTVVAIAAIAAAITGYNVSTNSRAQTFAAAGLFIAMALAITLIFELDEPSSGLITVPQAPMQRVAELILKAQPPP